MSRQKNNNVKKNREEGFYENWGLICNIGVYIFLFFFVICYAFYAPEGYIKIATNKYRYFRSMCEMTTKLMLPLILLYYVFYFMDKRKNLSEKGRELVQNLSVTDLFVLAFTLINIISYLLTDFKEEAFWGTNGWYMGFAMQMFFVGIYFLMSRFYDGKIDLLVPFMAVTLILFLWGLLNRFSVYPVDMQYVNPSFISSMGNINWFCGFWSVFFAIGLVLYLITEKRWLRIFSGIYAAVSLGMGAVEGSDSAFFAMGVVFLFLFFISFQKTEYMKRFLELCIYFCGACQVMRIISVWKPGSLNLISFLTDFVLGNLTLAAMVIFILLRFLLGKIEKKYKQNGKNISDTEEMVGNWKWLKYTAAGIIAGIFILYLILVIINTKKPGSIGMLSNYPTIFLFDNAWGSNRGASWRDGIAVFKALSPAGKLFGAGPDCFSAFAYSIPELSQRLEAEWGGSRLTNAHNECITYLVNMGVLGVAAFIGIFASSFTRLLKRAAKEPLCYVFAASLLSYFFHNQFSFSQVVNIPYIFMMLGLGENLMRRTAKEER